MKKLLIGLFVVFIQSPARGQIQKPLPDVRLNLQGYTPFDTLVTQHPDDTGRVSLTIRNQNGIAIARGDLRLGKKDGVWREYFNTGALSKLDEFKTGLRNGVSLRLSFLGQVQEDACYKNDTLHGTRTTYTNNGRVKTLENFTGGKPDGSYKSYYDDQVLQEESTYKMGVRDGVSHWYFKNGKPSAEYHYTNGRLNGSVMEFEDNGMLKSEGQYTNNEEDGEWKIYENGELVKRIIYRNGIVIKETNVSTKK
jgi:antitoxin component YwqK of YwqJK toxin-antitoxin module